MSESALHQLKNDKQSAQVYRPFRQSRSNHELSTSSIFETEETVFDFDTPNEFSQNKVNVRAFQFSLV